MKDQWKAFNRDPFYLNENEDGALKGLSFAVKDVFHVKGIVATAGNPDWERTHTAAPTHAEAVEDLLKEGSTLVGTTHTDELMFSLNGENAQLGTPVNPKAPERIPGGSSSGSAVAVASGLVDFALGTDTGGSVRIPSSYCGVYGFRPTHGAVALKGVIPLAPSFDTVGWMANDTSTLSEVGEVLLNNQKKINMPFIKMLIPEDIMNLLDQENRDIYSEHIDQFTEVVTRSENITLASDGLAEWFQAFRTIQGYEVWEAHGEWITEENPYFGPGISERFEWSSTISLKEKEKASVKRAEVTEHMKDLLGVDGVILMPTAPGVAPLLNTSGKDLEDQRMKTLQMTCISGLTGFPQISLPLTEIDGLPIGLSIIAGPNQDRRLLEWINNISSVVKKKTAAKV
ncbi:amidase [Halalkalibacter alkaliphilus]|uniref:Amidase n=1 Tax=Halalkalibacter alkaliphilus TaxID=2917993 RepID=A0A9X1ZWF9_9BACI|nr:amidase [Halalkalibacter alkaliphilus]MCL7745671.1 amidase [Halalkalibacter alkaliphilus]